MEIKYITVAALNRYIQYKFDQDIHLQLVYLKAEISNVRFSKGILYFVLKDDDSEIDALMFQNIASRLNFKPIDGMSVLVSGKVSVYQKRGRYSFQVASMEEAGLGDAYLEFLRLKDSLAKEGLFDQDKKLELPQMPEKIAVVTSPTGDALHDIITTINRRFPLAQIYLYPAIVQGKDAPLSLRKALRQAIEDKIAEVIIIARGGGTVEDLSCFNDEALARDIFASPIPTVSGVGHEQDYTISDFVASFRAPTPTGAAMAVTKDKLELIASLDGNYKQIQALMRQKLITSFNEYQNLANSYGLKNFVQNIDLKINNLNDLQSKLLLLSPKKMIDDYLQSCENLEEQLNRNVSSVLGEKENNIKQIIDKLILLNPLNLMNKGYVITYQNEKLITSINNLNDFDNLRTLYVDGEVESKIIKIKKKEV